MSMNRIFISNTIIKLKPHMFCDVCAITMPNKNVHKNEQSNPLDLLSHCHNTAIQSRDNKNRTIEFKNIYQVAEGFVA